MGRGRQHHGRRHQRARKFQTEQGKITDTEQVQKRQTETVDSETEQVQKIQDEQVVHINGGEFIDEAEQAQIIATLLANLHAPETDEQCTIVTPRRRPSKDDNKDDEATTPAKFKAGPQRFFIGDTEAEGEQPTEKDPMASPRADVQEDKHAQDEHTLGKCVKFPSEGARTSAQAATPETEGTSKEQSDGASGHDIDDDTLLELAVFVARQMYQDEEMVERLRQSFLRCHPHAIRASASSAATAEPS